MKVLLIDPFEKQAVYGHVKYTLSAPSLGLAYLASYLRQNQIESHILDARGRGLSLKEISDFICEYKPSIVGLTSTTPVFGNAIQIAKQVKDILPEVQLVMGGPHITGQGSQILEKWDFIDILAIGEGEQTLLEIAQGKDIRSIQGIVYRCDGELAANPPRASIADLDSLPFPARDFYDLKNYTNPLHEIYGKPFTTVISSRGCPFRCTFCSSQNTFGRNVRYRSVENVMEEIDFLIDRYKIRGLAFYDDTFTLSEERVVEMCSELEKRKISWVCNIRVNTATKNMIRMMKNSGCKLLHFGLESGDQLILDEIKKDITVEQIREVFSWVKNVGIDTAGSFIFGAPSETLETAEATIRLAEEIPLTFATFFILSPYPGTEVFKEMKKKGYMKEFEWTDVYAPKYGNPLINHPNISEEDLIRLQKEAYRRFYIRPGYVLRLIKSLNSWERFHSYFTLGLNCLRMIR